MYVIKLMKIEVTILKEIKGAFSRVRMEEREGGIIQLYCNLNKLITWKETDQFKEEILVVKIKI